jgi:hypothetical protein
VAERIRSRKNAERIAKANAQVRAKGYIVTHLLHDFSQPMIDPQPGDVVTVSTPQGTWRCTVRPDGSWMPESAPPVVPKD